MFGQKQTTTRIESMTVAQRCLRLFRYVFFLERVRGIDPGQRQFATGKLPIALPPSGGLASALRFTKKSAQSLLRLLVRQPLLLERVRGIEPLTQPWEGRVLPLNHTRTRFAVYVVGALLASVVMTVGRVQAVEVPASTAVHFDESLVATGWTVRIPDGANLTVFPGVLPGVADVTWTTTSDTLPALPKNLTAVGSTYRLSISGVTALNTATRKLAVALPNTASYWQKKVWVYDIASASWSAVDTKLNPATGKLQAGLVSLDAYIVVAQNTSIEEGIASWYCKTSCSKRYPTLHGTSNDFPVGSYVTVTNPVNNATVTVKIVSRWGQPAGRIIDLSWAAYAKLNATNKGLTKVVVTPKGADVAPAAPNTVATAKVESLPSLKVVAATSVQAPTVSSLSYRVVDAATGTVLAEKNIATKRSIASVTKLMAAVVYLDAKMDMKTTFTYQASDGTGKDASGVAYGFNNLTLRVGDVVQHRDLFYATLVGSANNGATALVRAAGLTRAEFVARMNAKAKAWGMTDTTFVEPSGLDPANISTAKDVAIMATKAFNGYEPIRYVTTKSSYTFVASKSGRHTVKTTDTLLTRNNGLTVTGGKTGYIDEAQYTYAVRLKNAQGAQIVISLLGSPSSATRFSEAALLANWAWKNYRWV